MGKGIIGILGGMGPEATADLYREIIRLTPATRDQDHIPVFIYANPAIPDRTSAILQGTESPLAHLIDSARLLERAGAGLLVIPCNTAHHYLEPLRGALTIPVLDMIAETRRHLESAWPGIGAAGLLATTGTVSIGLYQRSLEPAGLAVLVPSPAEQEGVQDAIRTIKSGQRRGEARAVLSQAGAALIDRGARVVILGCTEIPLALDAENSPFPVVNPTRILAQAAVDWALDHSF